MEGPPHAPGFDLPDDNHNAAINGAVAVTTFIALIAVIVRMWVRIKMVRSTGWDDYWVIAAMVLSFASWIVVIPQVHYGAGRHTFYILRDLGPEGLKTGLKLNFTIQVTYIFAIACVKTSVGLFLLRFAQSRRFKIFIWSVFGFLAFYTIAGTVTLLAQCTPFAMHFDQNTPGGKCFSVQAAQALAYTNGACNIVTDFCFAFLPVPLVWNLKINKRIKISIVCILSLGLFAASASVVKLYFITNFGKFGDLLWDSTHLTIWVAAECNVAILAASIPAMKPLFKAILGGSSYGSSSHGDHYNKNKYARQGLSRRNTNSGMFGRRDFEMMDGGVTTAVVSNERTKRDKDPYTISEESILPLQSNITGENQKGIMKTTQVSVQSNELRFPWNDEGRG